MYNKRKSSKLKGKYMIAQITAASLAMLCSSITYANVGGPGITDGCGGAVEGVEAKTQIQEEKTEVINHTCNKGDKKCEANKKKRVKCHIAVADKGYILAGKGDCGGKLNKSSCAGNNIANDPTAWIVTTAEECDKLNKGDIAGIRPSLLKRIDIPGLLKATNK